MRSHIMQISHVGAPKHRETWPNSTSFRGKRKRSKIFLQKTLLLALALGVIWKAIVKILILTFPFSLSFHFGFANISTLSCCSIYPIHGISSWRMMLGALNCKTEELLLSVMITRVLQTHDDFCSQKFPIHFCVPAIFRHFISCPSDSKIYNFDDFRAERKCALSVLISCH